MIRAAYFIVWCILVLGACWGCALSQILAWHTCRQGTVGWDTKCGVVFMAIASASAMVLLVKTFVRLFLSKRPTVYRSCETHNPPTRESRGVM